MNYLFRPTPVVVLGRDMGADVVALSQSPAGMMAGTPRASSRPSRSLATQGSPWIVRSGSMASFGTLGEGGGAWSPAGDVWYPFATRMDTLWPGRSSTGLTGLGQDDFLPIDPSSYDPGIDLMLPTDYSGAFAPPIVPVSMLPPAVPIAPDFGSLPFLTSSVPILPVTATAPIAPSSGAGPTGRSIPGTQPLNPVVQAGTGILNTIANFLKPSSAAPVRSLTLPGVGVNPNQPAPSFWSTSSVVPGIPNATVILGGAAVMLLLFAFMGPGGKK
jgi:hypothetical protein